MNTWLYDDNGNKCSVEYFGSREAAQAALDSLENCENCINCSDCSRCSRCSDCPRSRQDWQCEVTAPAADAEQKECWITHDGGICPLSENAVVDIIRRDNSQDHGPAGFWTSEKRCFDSWIHNGGDCDIVRYRAVKSRRWDVSYHAAALANDQSGMRAALTAAMERWRK